MKAALMVDEAGPLSIEELEYLVKLESSKGKREVALRLQERLEVLQTLTVEVDAMKYAIDLYDIPQQILSTVEGIRDRVLGLIAAKKFSEAKSESLKIGSIRRLVSAHSNRS